MFSIATKISTLGKTGFISIVIAGLMACSVADDPVTSTPPDETPALEPIGRSPASSPDTAFSVSTEISLTFDTALNPDTVSEGSFLLISGSESDASLARQSISGAVNCEPVVNCSTIIFTPSGNLAYGTNYIVLATGVITDAEGIKSIFDSIKWEFATFTDALDIPPVVSSTYPGDSDLNVAPNRIVTASFSEPLDPATVDTNTFLLEDIDIISAPISVTGSVSYSGVTAIFTPTDITGVQRISLDPDTVYRATITTDVADLDLPPSFLSSDYTWTFTTSNAPDNTAPSVSNVTPAAGANNVTTTVISAEFDEALDPRTVTDTITAGTANATFKLTLGGINVPGTAQLVGTTIVFTPSSKLGAGTYVAAISTGVTDLAGNSLADLYSWSFSTSGAVDSTPPSVSVVNPATDDPIPAPINTAVSAGFTEPLNPSTVNAASFLLDDIGTTPRVILGTVTYSGTTATFTPSSILDGNTPHRATIVATVTDLAGNSMVADYSWTFTTGAAPDDIAPFVIIGSEEPQNGNSGIDTNTTASATFSEPLDPATVTTATFTLLDLGIVIDGVLSPRPTPIPVTGSVSYSGVTATFAPTDVDGLAANTRYRATITTGVTDLAGNPLGSDYIWTFTTGADLDVDGPQVDTDTLFPTGNNVQVNTNIIVTFLEALDPSTINTATFTLIPITGGGLQVPVAATVSYAGLTATLNPAGNLARGITYTATVSAAVTDLSGNGLNSTVSTPASDFSWSFTTRPMGGMGMGN